MTNRKWRAVFYGTFLIACGIAIWPPFERSETPGKLKLGLDLRGGTHLVLHKSYRIVPLPAAHGRPPETLREVIRTLERRVNQLGVADPVITEYGSSGDRVLVQLPGMEDVARIKQLIITGAQLSLHLVDRVAPTREGLLGQVPGSVPPALTVLEGQGDAPGENAFYLVRRQAVVTGHDLKGAHAGLGDLGRPRPIRAQAARRREPPAGDRPQYRTPAGHRPRRAGDIGADNRRSGESGRSRSVGASPPRRPMKWQRSCVLVRSPPRCATSRSSPWAHRSAATPSEPDWSPRALPSS